MSAHSVLFLCDYKSLYAGNFIASLIHLGDALEASGSLAVYVFPEAAKERDWLKRLSENRTVELIPNAAFIVDSPFLKSKSKVSRKSFHLGACHQQTVVRRQQLWTGSPPDVRAPDGSSAVSFLSSPFLSPKL